MVPVIHPEVLYGCVFHSYFLYVIIWCLQKKHRLLSKDNFPYCHTDKNTQLQCSQEALWWACGLSEAVISGRKSCGRNLFRCYLQNCKISIKTIKIGDRWKSVYQVWVNCSFKDSQRYFHNFFLKLDLMNSQKFSRCLFSLWKSLGIQLNVGFFYFLPH